MNIWRKLAGRVRALFRKRQLDREMDAEMRAHLELRTQENIEAGMSAEEAWLAARRRFGPSESIKETCRDQRGLPWLENLLRDARFGARQLAKNPGFAAVAILTLAFGIGANTAIFALINVVLFKPVMAKHPEQLAGLYQQEKAGNNSGQWRHFSYLDYVDLRENKDVFSEMAAADFQLVSVRDGALSDTVGACFASANYFSLLGVSPALGRGFRPDEEDSSSPVAVLTHAFWQRLGGEASIIGRTLRLGGGFVTVVGVMPRGFTGNTLRAPALFLSLGALDMPNARQNGSTGRILGDRSQRRFSIFGRLNDGLSATGAAGRLAVLNSRFPQADPSEARERTLVSAIPDRFDDHAMPEQSGRQVTPVAVLAQGLTLLVLLITCLNLANMMLARGASRQKEIAVRLSLGAGRRRVLRQLLTEGFLLASLGAGAGALVSSWAASLLGTLAATRLGVELPLRGALVDWRLLSALGATCALATLFFSLGPALRLTRLDFNADLKRGPDADTAGRGRDLLRVKNLLAIGQMALVMALLVAAALFTRSAMNSVKANPGFEYGASFFVRLDERATGDADSQALAVVRDASERLAKLPGVESVSLASLVPFGPARSGCNVWPGPTPPGPEDRLVMTTYNCVGMNYFHTLGVSFLRGREFNRDEVETTNAPASVIINQKLAEQCWPGEDPIGKTLQLPPTGAGLAWRKAAVVGLVANVDWDLFDKEKPAEVYQPPAGRFAGACWQLHVRVAPGALAGPLMRACAGALSDFGSRVPTPEIRTLATAQRMSPQILLMEIGGVLFGLFGLVAVFLSFLGVYGLKAYEVARRVREIGIRTALGASAGDVVGMVLSESAGLALWGIGLGFALSLPLGLAARRFLYHVEILDPVSCLAVPLLLLAVATLAAWIPARAAARIDPMTALRAE
jgi:predicted permease